MTHLVLADVLISFLNWDAVGGVEAGGGEHEDQNHHGSPCSGDGCGVRGTAGGGCPHIR